jgi:hypothetical protein
LLNLLAVISLDFVFDEDVRRPENTEVITEEVSQEEEGVSITAIDSDFWLLEIAKSTIPIESVGQGVFAKAKIPKDSIICEYRGPIIDDESQYKLPYNDKLFGMNHNCKSYCILGEGVCSFINDCSNAMVLLQQNSSLLNEENDPSQCYESFSYNALALALGPKVFVTSSRDIMPGEEIFISYKWPYWKKRHITKYIQNLTDDEPIYKLPPAQAEIN